MEATHTADQCKELYETQYRSSGTTTLSSSGGLKSLSHIENADGSVCMSRTLQGIRLEGWRYTVDHDTDDAGWTYGVMQSSSSSSSWSPRCRWDSDVRRRRWVTSSISGARRESSLTAISELVSTPPQPTADVPAALNQQALLSTSLASASETPSSTADALYSFRLKWGDDVHHCATSSRSTASTHNKALDLSISESENSCKQHHHHSVSVARASASASVVSHTDLIVKPSKDFIDHMAFSELELFIESAYFSHDNKAYTAACSQLLAAADLVIGMLRRIFNGRIVRSGVSDNKNAEPISLFQMLHSITDRLHHTFMRIHEMSSMDSVNNNSSLSVPPNNNEKLSLRRSLKIARAKLSQTSEWDLFVVRHYEWQGDAVLRHRYFLTQLMMDAENPMIIQHHIRYMLNATGSPLRSTLLAFASHIHLTAAWNTNRCTSLSVDEHRNRIHNICETVNHFETTLLNYVEQNRIFNNIDTITGETYLESMLSHELHRLIYPDVMPSYHAIYRAHDAELTSLSDSGAAAAFFNAIPKKYQLNYDEAVEVLGRLSLFASANSKLSCVCDAIALLNRTQHRHQQLPPPPHDDVAAEASPPPSHQLLCKEEIGGICDPTDEKQIINDNSGTKSQKKMEKSSSGNDTIRQQQDSGETTQQQQQQQNIIEWHGADALLPVFIYSLLSAHIPHLWSQYEYMRNFINDADSRGQYGYALITLQAALVHILQHTNVYPTLDLLLRDDRNNNNCHAMNTSSSSLIIEEPDNNNNITHIRQILTTCDDH
jgi:hypothetical protein